jgi:hypothetical protein
VRRWAESFCYYEHYWLGFLNPFDSVGFGEFWACVEREWAEKEKFDELYGPSECDFCDDWYSCPDCPLRLDQEAEDEAEERAEREAFEEDLLEEPLP